MITPLHTAGAVLMGNQGRHHQHMDKYVLGKWVGLPCVSKYRDRNMFDSNTIVFFRCINTVPIMSAAICLKKDSEILINEFL